MSARRGDRPEIKVVLLGASGTGSKTSLLRRYATGGFNEMGEPTIGASFLVVDGTMDGVEVKMNVWDTAGQERYRALIPMYYRNAHAIVVGFDVTQRSTLETCDYWIKELRQKGEPQRAIIAVGNKIDLADRREVSTEEARAHFEAMRPPIPYFETSAKTGEGVDEVFQALARIAVEGAASFDNFNNNNDNTRFDDGGGHTGGGDNKCTIC